MAKPKRTFSKIGKSTTTTTTAKPTLKQKQKQKKKPNNISTGRPPLAKRPQASLSADMTRTLIRKHHQLNKSLARASSATEADELRKRIADLGGLQSYQAASMQGQSLDRGGDSSVVLVEWLRDAGVGSAGGRMLEVGALSTRNACARSGVFAAIERIDLFSQAEGIVQQDFMERPLPTATDEAGRFDMVSLSLVLNYVPDAEGRGAMLERTCRFLRPPAEEDVNERKRNMFPALFLVLPAPCTMNSRYMSEERLTQIMASLGYVLLERKVTAKLVYYLWRLRDRPVREEQVFGKKEVNPGAGRNNFSIVLKA